MGKRLERLPYKGKWLGTSTNAACRTLSGIKDMAAAYRRVRLVCRAVCGGGGR